MNELINHLLMQSCIALNRCLVDYPDSICRRVLYALPRPALGSAVGEFVELRAHELLHPVLPLHHFHHDACLRPDKRTRKGMEIRRHLFWRFTGGSTFDNPHLPQVGWHHVF